jgi:hypothetical protein
MILPKVRDPRLVTIRRGGSLTDSDQQLLALWAAAVAPMWVITASSAVGTTIRSTRPVGARLPWMARTLSPRPVRP